MAQTLTEWLIFLVALIIVLGVIVLLALGIPVPPELWAAFTLVLGFFFGNQTGRAQARAK